MVAGREARRGMAGGGGMLPPRPEACAAAKRIVAAGGRRAALGIILGTGLGGLVEQLDDRWSIGAADTGWLAGSTAKGHAGRLVCGTVDGVPALVLQGRVHAYEGLPAEALSRGVELLAALGAETLLVTNASGGLRPDMQSGELVVVTDHIDFVAKPWTRALAGGESVLRPRGQTFYDPDLVARALEAAARAGVPARPGVYAYFLGPNYETRAEYRMLRRLGADAVGMSTVPEVVAAASLGLAVAAVSVVTNVARPDALDPTDADEVCRLAGRAADGVWAIVETLLGRVPVGEIA